MNHDSIEMRVIGQILKNSGTLVIFDSELPDLLSLFDKINSDLQFCYDFKLLLIGEALKNSINVEYIFHMSEFMSNKLVHREVEKGRETLIRLSDRKISTKILSYNIFGYKLSTRVCEVLQIKTKIEIRDFVNIMLVGREPLTYNEIMYISSGRFLEDIKRELSSITCDKLLDGDNKKYIDGLLKYHNMRGDISKVDYSEYMTDVYYVSFYIDGSLRMAYCSKEEYAKLKIMT